MKRCLIFGAGEGVPKDLTIEKNDFLVAADGGLEYVKLLKLSPDLILGDFDSLGYDPSSNVNAFSNATIEKHPVEKDDTDMGLAIQAGLHQDCDVFYLFGGQGGRIDHTFANIQTMKKLAEAGKRVFLYGNDYHMTVLHNSEMILQKELFDSIREEFQNVSIFSVSDTAKNVTIQGAKYEVEKATLYGNRPLGVSNSFCGKDIFVAVEKGTLLILWQGCMPGIL